MSTYLYPDDAATAVARTNLCPNPRYIGADGKQGGGAAPWPQEDIATGGPDGMGFSRVTADSDATGAVDLGTDAAASAAVTPGEVYTASFYFRQSRPSPTSIVLAWIDSTGATISREFGVAMPPMTNWNRAAMTGVSPAGAAAVQVRWYLTGILSGDILDYATRLIEKGDQLGPYFDGGYPPAPPLSYAWQGTANASPSDELVPSFMTTPDLVLNYATETATGVTIHQATWGRAPLIVRSRPKYRSGVFEFYFKDRDEARFSASICDGSTNVWATSDDGSLEAIRFTPTGNVRLAWNTPYDSWTLTVPYAEADSEVSP